MTFISDSRFLFLKSSYDSVGILSREISWLSRAAPKNNYFSWMMKINIFLNTIPSRLGRKESSRPANVGLSVSKLKLSLSGLSSAFKGAELKDGKVVAMASVGDLKYWKLLTERIW